MLEHVRFEKLLYGIIDCFKNFRYGVLTNTLNDNVDLPCSKQCHGPLEFLSDYVTRSSIRPLTIQTEVFAITLTVNWMQHLLSSLGGFLVSL